MQRDYGYKLTPTVAVATNTTDIVIPRPSQLLWAHLVYTSIAGVNRQIQLSMRTAAAALVADTHAGTTQGPGIVRHYFFLQGIYRETAFINDEIQVPLPLDFIFPAGYILRVGDVNNVDAGDSMVLSYALRELAR